jgi:phage baseplate assembly protein W
MADKIYTIKGNALENINFAPETIEEEIMQNLNVLLATAKMSVPLDRGLGLEQKFLDKPPNIAETLIISEVYDAIEKYEPRVDIISVKFERNDMTGVIIPAAEVRING